MTNVRRGVPVGVDCGDVFEIDNREPQIVWTRKHTGSIGKTGETEDRKQCSVNARYYVELADGTYLAACQYHKAKLNGDSR